MGTLNAKIDIQKKFTVNGMKYTSVDEMPPDVRALYEKALASGPAEGTHTTTRITINGQEYSTIDDVPAAMRPIVSGALKVATAPKSSKITPLVLIALLLLGVAFVLMRLR